MARAMHIQSWLSLRGSIGRLGYLAGGLVLGLAKYSVDTFVAWQFGQSWPIANYWAGRQIELWVAAKQGDRSFYACMLLLTIPFIWAGVVLTAQRLRSAGLPLWLSLFFFIPILNIVLFVCLCVIPERRGATVGMPFLYAPSALGARAIAVLATALLGTLLTAFDVYTLGIYGVGLFVGLPFCLGMIAALLHGYYGVRNCRTCVGTAMLSVCAVAGMLLLIGSEGVVCLLMAAPIWLACAALGGVVGFSIQRHSRDQMEAAVVIVALALTVPAIMGAECLLKGKPDVIAIQTAINISASPEEVWPFVIAFPPLHAPTELYFRLGVAYPTDATITGTGAGAERRCNFSTGTFVEPIEIWHAPHLLKFSVSANPPPMRELSFYENVDAPHLHGFLTSRAGQFRLTATGPSTTRLEGTTWYQNDMAPTFYWRIWSDAIIHRIHLRVLNHIKNLNEGTGESHVADAR